MRGDELIKIVKAAGVLRAAPLDFSKVAAHLLPYRASARVSEWARTLVMAVFPYYIPLPERNVSRYAAVPDYHDVVGQILAGGCSALKRRFPAHRFEAFCDDSPLPEVAAAAASGLGWIGEHGLLITPEFGSYVFIGAIVTDLAMEKSEPEMAVGLPGVGCARCGRCEAACPAAAIKNKSRCASAISQKKGILTAGEENLIRHTRLCWGCDICQEVCPQNKNPRPTDISAFCADVRPFYHPGDPVEGRAFAWRGPAVIDRNARLF